MKNIMKINFRKILAVLASVGLYLPILSVMAQWSDNDAFKTLVVNWLSFLQTAGIILAVVLIVFTIVQYIFSVGVLGDQQGAAQKKQNIVTIIILAVALIIVPFFMNQVFNPETWFLSGFSGWEKVEEQVGWLFWE